MTQTPPRFCIIGGNDVAYEISTWSCRAVLRRRGFLYGDGIFDVAHGTHVTLMDIPESKRWFGLSANEYATVILTPSRELWLACACGDVNALSLTNCGIQVHIGRVLFEEPEHVQERQRLMGRTDVLRSLHKWR